MLPAVHVYIIVENYIHVFNLEKLGEDYRIQDQLQWQCRNRVTGITALQWRHWWSAYNITI